LQRALKELSTGRNVRYELRDKAAGYVIRRPVSDLPALAARLADRLASAEKCQLDKLNAMCKAAKASLTAPGETFALPAVLASVLLPFCFRFASVLLPFRFRFAFVSLSLLSVHFVCFRFTSFASVSLLSLSFHFVCFRLTSSTFVSLPFLSFHCFCFCFTSYAFVSLLVRSSHFLCFRFTSCASISSHFVCFGFSSFAFVSLRLLSFHFA
jgi:hypothetical protein